MSRKWVVPQFAVAAAVGESTSLTDGDGIATKYHGKLGHYLEMR
jgi:hypothetical protein